MRIEYPIGFKARMVQRMTGPDAMSAKSLSEEMGIATSTLCSWKAQAVKVVNMNTGKRVSMKVILSNGIRLCWRVFLTSRCSECQATTG
jgi:transposase-like protein